MNGYLSTKWALISLQVATNLAFLKPLLSTCTPALAPRASLTGVTPISVDMRTNGCSLVVSTYSLISPTRLTNVPPYTHTNRHYNTVQNTHTTIAIYSNPDNNKSDSSCVV